MNTPAEGGITRPALRFFGGKFKIANWVISHFPDHVCYVEPFAGGASVLLRKSESKVEILNDLDSEVVNFWRVLREQTEALIQAIELTPFSREESDLAYESSEDSLERARRFYVRAWQQRGGPRAQWRSGWRHTNGHSRSNIPAKDWANTDYLWAIAARLKCVLLEHDDALKVIERYDHAATLVYADPPYLAEVRAARWSKTAYTHEMDEHSHRELAARLNAIKGMAIISGYASDLYEELYSGWTRVATQTTCDSPRGAQIRTEVLWISPRAAGAMNQLELRLDIARREAR